MEYKIYKNKISILSKQDFNPQHILECGQIFSYEKTDRGYKVYSMDKQAEIVETENGYDILCEDTKYFENFFDLRTDYAQIKNLLSKHKIMAQPIEFGHGIRILKNDPFETLVSFIISANNNIKRIKKIIWSLRKLSKDGKSFPSLQTLLELSVEDFYALGLGYRSPLLYKALRQICSVNFEKWRALPTLQLRKNLIEIAGVGPKVADCVLLFGFSKMDVFPVDTWINQMYDKYYSPLTNREKIRQNLVAEFGNLSGYAQQYLFYFERSY